MFPGFRFFLLSAVAPGSKRGTPKAFFRPSNASTFKQSQNHFPPVLGARESCLQVRILILGLAAALTHRVVESPSDKEVDLK